MSNCVSRSVPEIHWHVAGTLSSQSTTAHGALTLNEIGSPPSGSGLGPDEIVVDLGLMK